MNIWCLLKISNESQFFKCLWITDTFKEKIMTKTQIPYVFIVLIWKRVHKRFRPYSSLLHGCALYPQQSLSTPHYIVNGVFYIRDGVLCVEENSFSSPNSKPVLLVVVYSLESENELCFQHVQFSSLPQVDLKDKTISWTLVLCGTLIMSLCYVSPNSF